MKIYVVLSGYYSDRDIDAVFLDKEKAKYYAKFNCDESGRVEEYETMDEMYEIDVHTINYYKINMAGDGTINTITEEKYEYIPGRKKFKEVFTPNVSGFNGTIIADSEEQAKKIMYDKRAAWLADKYGIKI